MILGIGGAYGELVNHEVIYDECKSGPLFLLHQQPYAPRQSSLAEPRVRRAVTISRQAGCGAVIIAEKLAQYLEQHSPQVGAAVDGV